MGFIPYAQAQGTAFETASTENCEWAQHIHVRPLFTAHTTEYAQIGNLDWREERMDELTVVKAYLAVTTQLSKYGVHVTIESFDRSDTKYVVRKDPKRSDGETFEYCCRSLAELGAYAEGYRVGTKCQASAQQ
jgi:hypothetical protein